MTVIVCLWLKQQTRNQVLENHCVYSPTYLMLKRELLYVVLELQNQNADPLNMLVNKRSDFLAFVFNCCFDHRQTRTVISYLLWSRNHSRLKNIFKFLLVVTLTSMLVYIFYAIKTFVLKISPVAQWLVNTNSLRVIFETRWL